MRVYQINDRNKLLLAILVIVLLGVTQTTHAQSIVETFSGNGTFTSSSGQSGFENPDWFNSGSDGVFVTNGFGEDVYQVGGNSFNGVLRYTGGEAFSVVSEFSNFVFSPITSTAGIRMNDPGLNSFLDVYVHEGSGGDYRAVFVATVNGSNIWAGNLNLGQTSLERATLKLDYQPDLANGGGIFDAFIDVSESGSFQHIGSLDGTEYTSDPSSSRLAFVGAANGQVDVDHFTLTTVPEPSAISMCGLTLLGFAPWRRKRSR